MLYTYFVITPGVDIGSFVQYTDKKQGNYFKFGDTNTATALGIRGGYTTHNPDIGVAAVMVNGLSKGNIGTLIKNDLINNGYPVVPGTEWFSVKNTKAWALFKLMLTYDNKTINDADYPTFRNAVLNVLNNTL